MDIKQRKKLLGEVINALSYQLLWKTPLVDKLTGKGSTQYKKHIHLTILINNITDNTKGESIRLSLPSDMGFGQASYKDGEFVYSEPYYLNLRIKDGKAIAGDASKFIIEKE